MISFREKAAIAFAVEAVKFLINGGCEASVDALNKAVSIAALQFADTLAAETCAKWGHAGGDDVCTRCGASTGERTARYEAMKARVLAVFDEHRGLALSFNQIHSHVRASRRIVEALLHELSRDGKITMRREGRAQVWTVAP